MKLENVKQIIDLAKNEGVSELKYEDKEFKVSVNFNVQVSQIAAPSMTQSIQGGAQSTTEAPAKKENYHLISSPFVGTFYTSPAPGKPNFVATGDKVSKGQTLCILEAMKIMNEIESDISGEIVEVCVENESLVEFGQTLFKIKA